jgi:hypothetical protein
MALMFRASLMAGALAGITFFAAPAAAAPIAVGPAPVGASILLDTSRPDGADSIAGWRRCGWGHRCGWGGGWNRGWRRNRIDGGDILIGAAIIGGAIAIANSNNRRQRERDVVIVQRDADFRDRAWDRRDERRFDRREGPRGTGAAGLDNAVTMCLDRIERDVRVDSVDNVERTASGWRVSGALFNGAPFQCRIGNGGQIDRIDYGDGGGRFGFGESAERVAPAAEGQWSEQRYAEARSGLGGAVRPDLAVSEAWMPAGAGVREPSLRTARRDAASAALPAYPGGPIPGEDIPEAMPEDIGG